MIEINLVPDVKQELLKAQAQRNIVISVAILLSIVAGAIVVLAAGYVYGVQEQFQIKGSTKTIEDQYNDLRKTKDLDKLLTIQSQLKEVSKLNADKHVTSRLYDMLNAVVPTGANEVKISSLSISSANAQDSNSEQDTSATESAGGNGTVVTIEGQTRGSYASLEIFEKTIAAAVIEYKMVDGATGTGDIDCGASDYQCRYLTVGGGDRSQAIHVSEMNLTDDENGQKTLFFKLSFTTVPELLSNSVSDVRIKIGQDGNVTDSYLGVPRDIFKDKPAKEDK